MSVALFLIFIIMFGVGFVCGVLIAFHVDNKNKLTIERELKNRQDVLR